MQTAYYLLKFARKAIRKYSRNFSRDFVFKGLVGNRVHVLGNGPSLTKSLHLIQAADDVIMVNFAPATDLFRELRPRYLCWADPALFDKTHIDSIEQKKATMYRTLKEVDWRLTIVVPHYVNARLIPVNNHNITFNHINTVPIDFSVKFLRFWLYQKNLSIPPIQNIVVIGVYLALQRGYQTVMLHGVDSDSFKRLCINSRNEMVEREVHYYGAEDRNWHEDKQYGCAAGTLYNRLACEVNMFRSYVDLADYARHLGIKILNASPRSMIDAFDRCDHPDEIP